MLLFVLILFAGISFGAFFCGSNGFYYSDKNFCDATCSYPCESLVNADLGLKCDTENYELFLYNPQTNKTIAVTKKKGFWNEFRNLLVIEDVSDNKAGQTIVSYLNTTAWIGLYDPDLSSSYNSSDTSRFVWWDGTHVAYMNWASGEPDNKVLNEDIGVVSPLGEHWVLMKPDGTWADYGKHYNDLQPSRRALVMWRNQLDCVRGFPKTETSTPQDIINMYCGGETPCFLCNAGGELQRCVSDSNGWLCPAGKVKCSQQPACSGGGSYDPSSGKCRVEPKVTCPEGGQYVPERDSCFVSSPVGWTGCPPGYIYDGFGGCWGKPKYTCPPGYRYNPSVKKCESSPSGFSFSCPLNPDRPCVKDGNEYFCSPYDCQDANRIQVINNDTPQGINDIPADGQVTEQGCMGTVYIMNGKDMRCRPPGSQTGLADCCTFEKNWFGLGNCKPEEKYLSRMLYDIEWVGPFPIIKRKNPNNCHYVGEYCAEKWNFLGIIFCAQMKKTYCCFNSPLAKIIHEQGRPQLGIEWGTPRYPNCRGFTAEEFQKLDFSKMDLSEWIEGVVESEIVPEIENRINDVINQIPSQMQ